MDFEVKMQKKDVVINLVVSAVTQIITLALGERFNEKIHYSSCNHAFSISSKCTDNMDK